MMTQPRLLDLFCGAGGIGKGYQLAGFHVTGVDIKSQPHYAGDIFYQDDALHFLDTHDLSEYDVLTASPECEGFSLASLFHPGTQEKYVNLIPPIRQRFQASKKLYVIENVAGAPLIKALMLCGTMFDLQVYRHRYFETNLLLFQPHHPKHRIRTAGPGAIARDGQFWSVGGHFGHKYEAAAAMGIDWMQTQEEIAKAIPPAYSQWIGGFLFDAVMHSREVAV